MGRRPDVLHEEIHEHVFELSERPFETLEISTFLARISS